MSKSEECFAFLKKYCRQKVSARGRRQRRTGRCQSPAMENPAGLRTPALWQLEDAEDPALAQGRVALRCF